MRFLAREPMLTGAFLQALVLFASVFVFDWDAEQVAAVQGLLLAAVALLVRQSVVAPATAAGMVSDAARTTAERLSGPVAGAVGQVTKPASDIATGVAYEVVRDVGGFVAGLVHR